MYQGIGVGELTDEDYELFRHVCNIYSELAARFSPDQLNEPTARI
jgi:hypothetical protein